MKLTVKVESKEKVKGFVRDFEDYGRINRPFDTKDFVELERAVILTVEEACEILDYLSYLHLRGGKDSFLKDLEKCNRNLYERIEQAEKSE